MQLKIENITLGAQEFIQAAELWNPVWQMGEVVSDVFTEATDLKLMLQTDSEGNDWLVLEVKTLVEFAKFRKQRSQLLKELRLRHCADLVGVLATIQEN